MRALLEQEALPIVVGATWILLLLIELPLLLVQDTWLSLVDGRFVARHWLPRHDTLTLWTLGHRWTDQQWGAHLLLYGLMRAGGLPIVLVFGVACVAAALTIVCATARTLGASARSAAIGVALPVLAAPWLIQVRAQSMALPFFAAVLALLALDVRRPGRRVLLVLPLLVVWANLHGSVTLGAGLAFLYGFWLARRHAARGLVLAIGSALSVFVSPYGFRLAAYYRLMLVHPPFAKYVVEWQPPSFGVYTAAFFVSALVAAVLFGAHRRVLTSFEQSALPLLLLSALLAVRSAVWFELALAIALPRLIDAAWPSRVELTAATRRINFALATGALALVVVVGAAELARGSAWLERAEPPAAAAAVAQAAGAHGWVLADEPHADWLLWQEPSLTGRVAYDVRFELFDARQLTQIGLLHDGSPVFWRRCASKAAVVTFAGRSDEQAALREHDLNGTKVIARASNFIAVAQPATAGLSCKL